MAIWPGSTRGTFARLVLPHLAAAYDLARWLVRDPADAQDVVQEALLRAWRGFDGLRGSEARPWLLTIVRHCAYRHLAKVRRATDNVVPFDEALHATAGAVGWDGGEPNPERSAASRAELRQLRLALLTLPIAQREAVVLRELHGLDYREIAAAQGVPIGTVMSRLARGRAALREALARRREEMA